MGLRKIDLRILVHEIICTPRNPIIGRCTDFLGREFSWVWYDPHLTYFGWLTKVKLVLRVCEHQGAWLSPERFLLPGREHCTLPNLSPLDLEFQVEYQTQVGIPIWIRIQIGIPSWIVNPLGEFVNWRPCFHSSSIQGQCFPIGVQSESHYPPMVLSGFWIELEWILACTVIEPGPPGGDPKWIL